MQVSEAEPMNDLDIALRHSKETVVCARPATLPEMVTNSSQRERFETVQVERIALSSGIQRGESIIGSNVGG